MNGKKDYSPSGKPVIRVDANDADIRVNDWDRKDIEARIITEGYKIGPDAVRVTESQSGNQITLEMHTPRLLGLVLHRHSVRVEVQHAAAGRSESSHWRWRYPRCEYFGRFSPRFRRWKSRDTFSGRHPECRNARWKHPHEWAIWRVDSTYWRRQH